MNIPYSIWHIAGETPGPNVIVLGGVHGDEKVGVEVIRRLLSDFELQNQESGKTYGREEISGNLFLGFGNPKAIERGTRAAEDGPDLNRSFQEAELAATPSDGDTYDLIRARELSPLLGQADFLFDIHNTYSPSVPFVCMGNDNKYHKEFYSLLPVQYVLTDPDNILPQDVGKNDLGTTDYFVNSFGGSEWSIKKYGHKRGVAFAYESGSQDDFGKVETVQQLIHSLLNKTGTKMSSEPIGKFEVLQEVYRITGIIKAKEPGGFIFENDSLKEGWANLKKDSCIGTYPKSGAKELMPYDGKLLFQKKTTDILAGQSICYIARKMDDCE